MPVQGKGKGRALVDLPSDHEISFQTPRSEAFVEAFSSRASSSDDDSSNSSSDSASELDSDTSGSDSSDDESERPEGLMQKYLNLAKENVRRRQTEKVPEKGAEEQDVIHLESSTDKEENLPPLDPGALPPSYITPGSSRKDAPSAVRDLDAEQAESSASKLVAPAPPVPPPELTKSGKPLTKRERKALKEKTAGPSWFDLPAPAAADLPRMYREVEALRLRNQLDPKRFYRKEEGEGKGIKGLPKHFAIGAIIPTSMPFGTASGDNLSRAERKRTLVDELVDDAEARRYAKKKFLGLQGVRGAKGRGTLAARQAKRKPKW